MSTGARLAELLARELAIDPARLAPGATLEELEIDSLRMIELAFAVEDAFGVTIGAEPAQLMARVKTLGDFSAYVDELLAARTAGEAAS
ncbi:MAG TPA: phosphopantetheine-binding protein [Usitatibacter sp.]|nr:phosphopantetheine-binding protein [Usitatibacter sp.]